ncbi:MAG: ABC transporter ATP-binding protein [Oscillospiraceae bacterium]|nr:ABC transporter ATP-binding protein [Oscillospiraceae bacterium]
MDDILSVKNLKKYFPSPNGLVKAVDDVSFSVKRGTTMGLVGESGCGKSTTGRCVLRLSGGLTGGQVLFQNQDLYKLSKKALRALRPKLQIIFQDPFSSLSPRLTVGELMKEAVREHRIVPAGELEHHIDKIMENCGLKTSYKSRYPHEFSGGQRQRICIARALALNPDFVLCDEPVSALDVSIQAQIVNLLQKLQQEYGLTYLFISHDLSVVEHICDTVAVMYLGKIVEYAPTKALFDKPLHPYTQALFSAIPVPDPNHKLQRILLQGNIPSPIDPPSGCRFHPRCPHAMDICSRVVPVLAKVDADHTCACHLYHQVREASKE